MTKLSVFVLIVFLAGSAIGQTVPSGIRKYLDATYRGWKLSPSGPDCGAETNNGVIAGDFDSDRQRDYAVKLVRRDRGYFIAFLRRGTGYKPFVLDRATAEDINNSAIHVWKKGGTYESAERKVYVRHDAPTDFRCESDVGGIHLYRNGKFVHY